LCEREQRIWPLSLHCVCVFSARGTYILSAALLHGVGVPGIFYFAAGFFSRARGSFSFWLVSERLVESASILRSAPPHSKILTIENKDSILAVTARNFVDLLTNEKLQVLHI
jgi:hypothetical protein